MSATLHTVALPTETATERARRLAAEAAQAGLAVWDESLLAFNTAEGQARALADLATIPNGVRQEAAKLAEDVATRVERMAAIMARIT